METVLDSLPVAVITTDRDRKIVGANPAALELFGYGKGELVGHEVEALIPRQYAETHPRHYENFKHAPSNRPMGKGRDLSAVKKDGTVFPVEVGLTVLGAEPPLYLASVIDLSLRKKTEMLLRERQELLQSKLDRVLEEQLLERTRLEERQRLGRELHDSLSQNLYGIGLGLRTVKAKMGKGQDPVDALEYCLTLTEASLVEMRALLFRLRPKSLENVPLADVLASHAQAVSARTKLPVEFEQHGNAPNELPYEQKYTLYRIATEALHNCVKHAQASTVKLVLTYGRRDVSVEIRDDGQGFSLENSGGGHGLATMKERAAAVEGCLELESGAAGTVIAASVPWRCGKNDLVPEPNPTFD